MNDQLREKLSAFHDKPRLPWRGYGLYLLIIPLLVLTGITVSLWQRYREHSHLLEAQSAQAPELNTKITAYILNRVVDEVQRQTDALAEKIGSLPLNHSLTEQKKQHMVQWTAELVRRQITCSVDSKKITRPLAKPLSQLASAITCHTQIDNTDDIGRSPATEPLTLEDGLHAFNVAIYGSAVAFAKEGINLKGSERSHERSDRWATYSHRTTAGMAKDVKLPDEDYADPSNPNTAWYYQPVSKKRNQWSKPYLDDVGETYMVTYTSLIRHNQKIIGVVIADIAIDQLKEIIEELISGYDGFGALTDNNGVYLYHPERDYVKDGKTIWDIAREKHDKDRYLVGKLVKTKTAQRLSHLSTTTHEDSWLIVEPIQSNGWSIQNTFFKESFYSEYDLELQRRLTIKLTTSIILLITCLLATLINIFGWGSYSAWSLSIFLAIMLATGIWKIWDLALNQTKPKNSEGQAIDSLYAIDQEKRQLAKSLSTPISNYRELLTIPTGIYVQTVDLKSANSVNISGRVWQVFHTDCTCSHACFGEQGSVPAGKDRLQLKTHCDCPSIESKLLEGGVQFGSAKNVKLSELPDAINENCDVVKSWWVQADIITQFDYSRYPLEVEYIDIHIQPKSIQSNVFVVPDVESYKFGSNRRPGMDSNIFIPGWDMFRSYFTLSKPDKSMPTFGMQDYFDKEVSPELHFKMGLKRQFVDAFISNLTPLIVGAIILFSVALLPPTIDISRILGICVSVFFVTVFAHLAVRRSISTGEIFYLEYFYFSIYITLLLVPVNAFRKTLGIRSQLFEYKNGLIYKILFWPILLSISYIVTIAKFY